MTKVAFKHFFAEHLLKVLIGVLCAIMVGAWADLRGQVEAVRLEFEAKYATKDKLDAEIKVIDLRLQTLAVGEAKSDATLDRIDGRLLDIGDRLGRIEGELRGRP